VGIIKAFNEKSCNNLNFACFDPRLGFAIGNEDVIQLMNNVKAPYNVNSMTSEVARKALSDLGSLDYKVKELLIQREDVMKKLEGLDFVVKVHPSDTNFVLFQVKKHAQKLYKEVSKCDTIFATKWLSFKHVVVFLLDGG